MGKFQLAMVTISGEAHYRCPSCSGTYRYPLEREFTGVARTYEEAEDRARAEVRDFRPLDTDLEPCPWCGWNERPSRYQKQGWWHLAVTIGLLFLSGTIVTLGAFPAPRALSYADTGISLAVSSAIAFALHVAADFVPFARSRRRSSTVEKLVSPPADTPAPAPRSFHPSAWAMALIGTALMLVPYGLLSANKWPVAVGNKPDLVGPGDPVRCYFPNTNESIKGLWTGHDARATLVEPGGGRREMPVRTETQDWGRELKVKNYEQFSGFTPWVETDLPDDPALAGSVVAIEFELGVTFPVMSRKREFQEETETYSARREFSVVRSEDASFYTSSFWVAAAGSGLFAAAGLSFWRAARRRTLAIPAPSIIPHPGPSEP